MGHFSRADPGQFSRALRLIEELRAAHAPDATPQLRYATAVNINRALLGASAAHEVRNAATPAAAPAQSPAGPPLDALLGALAAAPRDQLVTVARTLAVPLLERLASRAQTLFAHAQPNYLPKPVAPPVATAATAVAPPSRSGRKS